MSDGLIHGLTVFFLISLPACGLIAAWLDDLVGAVFTLSCYSFFLVVLWSLMGAVDVAFTEAVVGVGLSTLFMLVALFRTDMKAHGPRFYETKALWPMAVCMLVLGGLLFYASTDLAIIGSHASPPNTYVSPWYIVNSLKDAHTPNVVTTVLADYRGFDTLIETTVIFTAAIACLVILGPHVRRRGAKR